MQKPAFIYTVSEINQIIKGLIQGDPRLSELWGWGGALQFKHHRSGHMYFTIKDRCSSLRCVFFRSENRYCRFTPEDGMELLLYGKVSVYEPGGLYQFYVLKWSRQGWVPVPGFEQLKKN